MLKYLTILLDDAAVSFCHYKVRKCPNVISEDVLRRGITFAMKENLSTQFVFPNHELPEYVYDISIIGYCGQKLKNDTDFS